MNTTCSISVQILITAELNPSILLEAPSCKSLKEKLNQKTNREREAATILPAIQHLYILTDWQTL